MRITNRNVKLYPVQKHTKLDTLLLTPVLYGCETWANREIDKSRITLAERKIMSRMVKYTWQDYKTNEDNLSEFKLTQL
jgi:hypothetical protein